jgi:hypothetical protein
MANSNFFILLALLCCLVLTSCGRNQSKENNNNITSLNKQSASSNNIHKEVSFLPDSTVNNILILHNAESSKLFYPEISSEKFITFLRNSPVLGFTNKKAEEYLLLYQYEGGVKYAFSCFEIGKTKSINKDLTATDYEKFKTENGLMLGMSLNDLERIKGKSYTKEKNKIIYQIIDHADSDFLKSYNMPAYFLECILEDNKIVKIKYGFDYP